MSCFSDLSPQAMERKMKQAKTHLDRQRGQYASLSPQVHQSLEKNKETSDKNWLKVQISSLWLCELILLKLPSQEQGRLPAFLQFNNNDLDRVNMYKQAPCLNVHHGHALQLIRLRMQAWTKYIPTRLHFSARQARNEYHFSYCGCAATVRLRDTLIPQINRKLRLLDDLPWSSSPIPSVQAYY